MKKINYTLQFTSDWNCGSGLDSGMEADILTIKDFNGLPFVPGKTIKGILREASEEINEVKEARYAELIEEIFGNGDDNFEERSKMGGVYFSDLTIPQEVARHICTNQLQSQLFRRISFTAIQPDGIVKLHTLRTFEFCIPIALEGYLLLYSTSKEVEELLYMTFKWVRGLGIGRNRGFGRCIILEKKQ